MSLINKAKSFAKSPQGRRTISNLMSSRTGGGRAAGRSGGRGGRAAGGAGLAGMASSLLRSRKR